jgi:hypothetical protein
MLVAPPTKVLQSSQGIAVVFEGEGGGKGKLIAGSPTDFTFSACRTCPCDMC